MNMHEVPLRPGLLPTLLVLFPLLALTGCGEDSPNPAAACVPGTTGPCPMEGQGTLAITIEGLPAGVMPAVSVTGPTGAIPFAPSAMVGGGTYMVAAMRVAAPDPIVRRAFAPTVSGSPVCVKSGMTSTVKVTYAEIASSNKLWLGNANAMAPLLGFASAGVRMTGTPPATVSAQTKGSRGLAFDRDGNLWVAGDTIGDTPLLRYPASMLGASGTKTADVLISSAVFSGGFPGSRALAFDSEGNLWVSVIFSDKVVKLAAAQLTTSGAPVPPVELTGFKGPQALAFDGSGNLWVANAGEGQVLRIDAARLGASGAVAPGLVVTASSPPPVIGLLSNPSTLAFDSGGSLWVGYEGGVFKLPVADLMGTGTRALTPAIQISSDVLALPEGMAFDEGGGLWFSGAVGKFGRLGPEQLTSGGPKTPSTVITSASVGNGGDFALFPAPAALPLYHRWP